MEAFENFDQSLRFEGCSSYGFSWNKKISLLTGDRIGMNLESDSSEIIFVQFALIIPFVFPLIISLKDLCFLFVTAFTVGSVNYRSSKQKMWILL